MSTRREPLATVTRIRRHPLKSAAPENVENTKIGWHGLHGDRRYAFLRSANRSGFPWLTAREVPELVTWEAYHVEPGNPQRSDVMVQVPGEPPVLIRDCSLADRVSALAGEPVQLVHLWSGIFDAEELSLIGRASMEAICAQAGVAVDAERFRVNIEVEALNAEPFAEDRWIGERLIFGDRPDSARLLFGRRDRRCAVVDIDPATGIPSRGLLEQIVKHRQNHLGIYAKTEAPGTICVGDLVYRLS